MKKLLLVLLSSMLFINVSLLSVHSQDLESQIAEKESELAELRKQLEETTVDESETDSNNNVETTDISNQIALGVTNSPEQINQLLELFGANQAATDSALYIDGLTLNEYLNDGSNESTDIFSSVIVNTDGVDGGVNVEVLTPDNILNVSASAYQNAAITAGATNADIKIASVEPVTGEGALGGVYEIFNQAGFGLEAVDIQTAENLIEIEQILKDETNMSENEISKLVTEYNLAIVNDVEGKDELTEEEVSTILNDVLSSYNFIFSENVHSMLLEHGLTFSKSNVSKDPETKNALEETMGRYEILEGSFSQGDLEVVINDLYFTDERNEYEETNYDNIFIINYTLTNNGEMEHGTGFEFSLYVDGVKANDYFMLTDIYDLVSPGRTTDVQKTFGFNGEINNLELELSDMRTYDEAPLVIKLDNTGTPVSASPK